MTDDRQPPNYSDASCGHGADRPTPDVAGSLYGLRGWALTDDGWLRGATYPVAWGPDWNDARCLVSRRLGPPVQRSPYGHPFWGNVHDANQGCVFPIQPGEPIKAEDGWRFDPCDGLDPTCGCGFYAYYDAAQGRASGYGNIRGIIEATGKCVVGPKGFRAQRARVIAIVQPQTFKPRMTHAKAHEVNSLKATLTLLANTRKDLRLRAWFAGTNQFGVLWGTSVLILALLGGGAGDRGALLGAVASTVSAAGILTWLSRRRTARLMVNLDDMVAMAQTQLDDLTADVELFPLLDLVRENYPGIKVYPTMAALLADYPTSDVRALLDLEPEDSL